MNFDKMTVVQLKDYMRQNNIKPLGGRRADLLERIYIYENNIKTSLQVNKKEKMSSINYDKLLVKELKELLRTYGLPVGGRKQELINRLNAYTPKKSNVSSDNTYYSKMTVAVLKEKLKELKLPVSGRKADLVQRLVDASNKYRENMEMGMEDRDAPAPKPQPKKETTEEMIERIFTQMQEMEKVRQERYETNRMFDEDTDAPLYQKGIPLDRVVMRPGEGITYADVFLPMTENAQLATPLDHMYAPEFFHGRRFNKGAYTDALVDPIMQNLRTYGDPDYNQQQNFTINDLVHLLPPDHVEQLLDNTDENKIEFVSEFTDTRIDIMQLELDVKDNQLYDFVGWIWFFDDDDITGHITMVFRRKIGMETIRDQLHPTTIKKILTKHLKRMDVVEFVIPRLRYAVLERYYSKEQINRIFGMDKWELELDGGTVYTDETDGNLILRYSKKSYPGIKLPKIAVITIVNNNVESEELM